MVNVLQISDNRDWPKFSAFVRGGLQLLFALSAEKQGSLLWNKGIKIWKNLWNVCHFPEEVLESYMGNHYKLLKKKKKMIQSCLFVVA